MQSKDCLPILKTFWLGSQFHLLLTISQQSNCGPLLRFHTPYIGDDLMRYYGPLFINHQWILEVLWCMAVRLVAAWLLYGADFDVWLLWWLLSCVTTWQWIFALEYECANNKLVYLLDAFQYVYNVHLSNNKTWIVKVQKHWLRDSKKQADAQTQKRHKLL